MWIERTEREEEASFHGQEVTQEIPMSTTAVLETVTGTESDRWYWSLANRCDVVDKQKDNKRTFSRHSIVKSLLSNENADRAEQWLDNENLNCGDDSSDDCGDDSDTDSDTTITNESVVTSYIVHEVDEQPKSDTIRCCVRVAGVIDVSEERPSEFTVAEEKCAVVGSRDRGEHNERSGRKLGEDWDGSGMSVIECKTAVDDSGSSLKGTAKTDSTDSTDCAGNIEATWRESSSNCEDQVGHFVFEEQYELSRASQDERNRRRATHTAAVNTSESLDENLNAECEEESVENGYEEDEWDEDGKEAREIEEQVDGDWRKCWEMEATVEEADEEEDDDDEERRNEWNGGIDESFSQSGRSGHGHAPGETGISTGRLLTTPTRKTRNCSTFASFASFDLLMRYHQLVELPCPSKTTESKPSESSESAYHQRLLLLGTKISPTITRQSEDQEIESEQSEHSPIQEQDAASQHALNFSSSFNNPHHCRRPQPPHEPHGQNLGPWKRTRTRRNHISEHNLPSKHNNHRILLLEQCQCGGWCSKCHSVSSHQHQQQHQPQLQDNGTGDDTTYNSHTRCYTSNVLLINCFNTHLPSQLPLTNNPDNALSLLPESHHDQQVHNVFEPHGLEQSELAPLLSHTTARLSQCVDVKSAIIHETSLSHNPNSGANQQTYPCPPQLIPPSLQILPEQILQRVFLHNFTFMRYRFNCQHKGTFVRDICGNEKEDSLLNQSESCEAENERLINIFATFLQRQQNQTDKGEKKDSFLPSISDNIAMQQRLSSTEHMRLRSVLRKPGHSKKQRGRTVTFNESLNLFYEAECSCWVHEDEYARLRQEEHDKREREELFHYEPPPIEFDDPPTLSPPEGYKDRFFPQEMPIDPDVTRVTPPSPPAARRKVFLKDNPVVNGQEDEEEADDYRKSKTSRLGGILKGGRLWRSNSAEGKKVVSPQEEPDVVKCTESRYTTIFSNLDDCNGQENSIQQTPVEVAAPLKVSTGTAPLRTSEQIRLAVDSTLRFRANKKKPECSSLVEKLRWLTSLDDDDSSDSNTSGFATWPSRDKNGTLTKSTASATKADAGTSTTEEFIQSAIRQPPINTANEAKIKQISYTLEDIDEGLKSGENELESFITEDGGRIERLRKRYGDDIGGDDYGFSRRPSVKGIKPKFSSTNQIFAQFTMRKTETPIPQIPPMPPVAAVESQYENARGSLDPSHPSNNCANPNSMALLDNARILNYEFANAPGRQSEESRAHFEMIRQSFEPGAYVNFSRPHSWSVSTLPHPHHTHHAHSHSHSMCMMAGGVPPNNVAQQINNLSNNSSAGAGAGAGTGSVSGSGTGPGSMVPSNVMPVNNSGTPSTMTPQQQQLIQQQQQQQQQQAGPIPSSVSIMAATSHLPQSQYATMINNGGIAHNMYTTNSNNGGNGAGAIYGTLPHQHQMNNAVGNQQAIYGTLQNNLNGPGIGQCAGGGLGNHSSNLQQQQMYGTVRRVPNVIGRPLFLHYGALSVEAHPNKISYSRNSVPETPSPTQQPPPIRYYGPPIRYYNPPPPVPPRTAASAPSSSAAIGGGVGSVGNVSLNCTQGGKTNNPTAINVADHERGVPEGATDEEPGVKEPYSMNI